MTLRSHLLRMIDYDQFANGAWMDFLSSCGDRANGCQFIAEAEPCIWHIGSCHQSWFDWLTESETDCPVSVREFLVHQAERMRAYIATCSLEEVRRRSHPDFGTWEWTIGDVAFHALSHGIYHRGQLRTLAEKYGLDDWPETDWEVFTARSVDESTE